MSIEVSKQEGIDLRIQARTLGQILLDLISDLSKAKGYAVTDVFSLPIYFNCYIALKEGWLENAVTLIGLMDETYFSVEEKQDILNSLNFFIGE